MKTFTAILLLLIFSAPASISQTDTSALLTEMGKKLTDHSLTVSKILSDPSYEMLHPKTAFRELIKKNAATEVLTIAKNDEAGKKIKVTAIVKNREGQPIPNALVYLYQTDSRGWYAGDAPHVLAYEGDFRHARLFGYVKTDKNGSFELHTVKPSGYPNSDLPAHIHVHVVAEGYRSFGTEFLFQDDERLKGEILNRAVVNGGIIAKPESATAPFIQKFSYTMTLQKQ